MSRFAGQSKFFGGGDNTSSESSESSQEEDQVQDTTAQTMNKRSKYMMGSDDEEEEERTIKSGATKRAEALDKVLEDVRKHANIADFNSLDNDFNKVEVEIKKASDDFEERGTKLPIKVLKIFLLVEDTINEVTNEQKKKMSKINSVSYNKMKQRLKKYLSTTGEDNMTYEKQLQRFREAPPIKEEPVEKEEEKEEQKEEDVAVEEEEEEEEEEDSESDEEIKAEKAAQRAEAKKEAAKAKAAAKADEPEEYYDEEYDGEEAGSEDEDNKLDDTDEIDTKLRKKYAFLWKEREEMLPEERRWKWVKKECIPEELTTLIEKLSKKKKGKGDKQKERDDVKTKVADEVVGGDDSEYVTTVKTRNDLNIDYSLIPNVKERLEILTQERFKGKFSMQFHVQILTKMADQMPVDNNDIFEIRLKVNVLIMLVGTLIQTARTIGVLTREEWLETNRRVAQLLVLVQRPLFVKSLKEAHTPVEPSAAAEEEDESMESRNQFECERQVFPSLSNFAEGLNDQLWRAYQSLSHTSIDYLQRISDENKLLSLCDSLLSYFNSLDQLEYQARVAIVKLNYIHYKNDSVYERIKIRLNGRSDSGVYYLSDSHKTIAELVAIVQKWGLPKQRVRVTLQQIYHLAMHNKLREARELMMKTHMSQVISMQPIENQILYNRALVQIGLTAFRQGKIRESHDILADICQNSKHKELLAQRISSVQEKTQEFEAEEKKRQIPFHFQINIQLLECIHFISSMLLEIPAIAANQFALNKTTVSKNFKRLIEQYDTKAFHLAAENYRDYIVNAARALNQSDWKSAVNNVLSIQLFNQIPDFETQAFKDNLTDQFKKAALEAFLYRAAKQYKSFELRTLQEMFGLADSQLRKYIGQLIMFNRLQMSLDIKKQLLIVDEGATDIKELQQLSLQYVSQIQVMVTQNEHIANFMSATDLSNLQRSKSTATAPVTTSQQAAPAPPQQKTKSK